MKLHRTRLLVTKLHLELTQVRLERYTITIVGNKTIDKGRENASFFCGKV